MPDDYDGDGFGVRVFGKKKKPFKDFFHAIKWLFIGLVLAYLIYLFLSVSKGSGQSQIVHPTAVAVGVVTITSTPVSTAVPVPTSLPIITVPKPTETPKDKELIFPTLQIYPAAVATGVTMTVSGGDEVYLEAGTLVVMTGIKRTDGESLIEVTNNDMSGTVPLKEAGQCSLRNVSMSGMLLCDDWFSLSLK